MSAHIRGRSALPNGLSLRQFFRNLGSSSLFLSQLLKFGTVLEGWRRFNGSAQDFKDATGRAFPPAEGNFIAASEPNPHATPLI